LQVFDPTLANTYLADRIINTQSGEIHNCYVPMPISPWKSIVRVFSGVNSQGDNPPKVFHVETISQMGIKTYRDAIDWNDAELGQAIKLGNRFCYNAGWLPTLPDDQAYCSPDGSLRIQYLPTLIEPKSGKESVTPMRISESTAIMQANQKLIVPYTIAGRAVMYWHEYSHKFKNNREDWELEADLNGLTIYLGLGYSRYEALQVYEQVFKRVPSPENNERMAHIQKFIKGFELYIKKSKN
jgi:hypothetical protein